MMNQQVVPSPRAKEYDVASYFCINTNPSNLPIRPKGSSSRLVTQGIISYARSSLAPRHPVQIAALNHCLQTGHLDVAPTPCYSYYRHFSPSLRSWQLHRPPPAASSRSISSSSSAAARTCLRCRITCFFSCSVMAPSTTSHTPYV